MTDIASSFINFALHNHVLQFGSFTLKSGRVSPYFFNAGAFNRGDLLEQLGQFYADTIIKHQINFDLLFGPAYKGIPLVSSTAIAMSRSYHISKPFAFNRKEVKDHGEGGHFVGAPVKGKVLIIDDVITAGTAFRQACDLIQESAEVAGLIIMLDRQEQGLTSRSAIDEIKEQGIPVHAIACLDDIIHYLNQSGCDDVLESVNQYRERYGA